MLTAVYIVIQEVAEEGDEGSRLGMRAEGKLVVTEIDVGRGRGVCDCGNDNGKGQVDGIDGARGSFVKVRSEHVSSIGSDKYLRQGGDCSEENRQ